MLSNFTKIDEEFICENCGKHVPKLGYTCRNHCPYCLHSKHVDINPGDRAETCHGTLEPIGLEIDSKKGYVRTADIADYMLKHDYQFIKDSKRVLETGNEEIGETPEL